MLSVYKASTRAAEILSVNYVLLVRTWTRMVLRSVTCVSRVNTRAVKALPSALTVMLERRRRTQELPVAQHVGWAHTRPQTGRLVCRVKWANINLPLIRSRVGRVMQASIKANADKVVA